MGQRFHYFFLSTLPHRLSYSKCFCTELAFEVFSDTFVPCARLDDGPVETLVLPLEA